LVSGPVGLIQAEQTNPAAQAECSNAAQVRQVVSRFLGTSDGKGYHNYCLGLFQAILSLEFRTNVDHYRKRKENMDRQSVTGWIDQLANGNRQAAEHLWQHVCAQLQEFARQKLDVQTRRSYDESDAANSAFHSLCRGLADGRIEAENRDALWGLLAVITSRKIAAQRRRLNRQKRGGGAVQGESGFGDAGIDNIGGSELPPDVLAEVSESCAQLLDAIPDESMRKIVLLKFHGSTNGEVASELNCTRRTIERKLERIRRIWVEAGLHEV